MDTSQSSESDSTLDDLVEHAVLAVPDRPGLEPYLRAYYAHADRRELDEVGREDLFGMAADHLQLAQDWRPGDTSIAVVNPRIALDGWGGDHTVVLIVTDDMPFLVDSVMIEISRQGIGIHRVVHPIVAPALLAGTASSPSSDPTVDGGGVSLIALAIDRLGAAEARRELDEGLRRVLDDVAAAVGDWRPMRSRMQELSAGLDPAALPIADDEVAETRAFLDWLADDHFLFLGARDYELGVVDGEDVLRIVPGSGLGILASENHLGRPRRLAELAPRARDRVRERRLLNLTKAGTRATVHRASYLDYVGIKTFDDSGTVTGERRFLGLFTSEVYNRSITVIPRARRTAARVVARSGFPVGGHDEKRLRTILERYPRDDLLQMDADELFPVAMSIAGLQERRRVRVFSRREAFGRFVTVLVFLPRDRYTTSSRSDIEKILIDAFGGTLADWDAQMSESVLARLRFVIRVDDAGAGTGGIGTGGTGGTGTAGAAGAGRAVARPQVDAEVDDAEIEARIESLIRLWVDGFADALVARYGEEDAGRLLRTYGGAGFDENYQWAFEPRAAAADVAHLEALVEPGDLRLKAYREPARPTTAFRLKLYRWGERISLTRVMPTLTNLGVTVVDERPYEVRAADGRVYWIYDFALEHDGTDLDFAEVGALVEETVLAVWSGRAEDDGFNRLVLRAGLGPTDVRVLRAYARYLHQIGFPYARASVEQAMLLHPDVVRLLVDLFRARFDPDAPDGPAIAEAIRARIDDALTAIESLDHDRVLRRLANLISATVRTTWGQRDLEGRPHPYLAFKFDCRSIVELPDPRPAYEIFVFSPRFEGVHLRAGPVARGGIRASDRNEDYRTEILGLVKAQMVKNAVIVPAGAKGGFILKQRPVDPVAVRDEVVACYRLFISALLDLTDNIVDGRLVPPDRTRRYDGDDPYLVVAADKGTATFSDLANGLAQERSFWLGDAFASGGSHGYDHKAMGITARGAWESVKRHFRELGIDVGQEPFTAVGIGDMSGDVFGNGMLRSPCTRLVAAFDHRHIFIDPDPDPAASYAERERLFALPRSSWDDYDRSVLSPGGAVQPRTAKSIELSPQAREALGTDASTVTPDQLISIVLRAPVDLLWNGGVGTYVKASAEQNLEVGDKSNDAIRVDARSLRCSVIGEGGNLGVTQRGRIEFAQAGGRVFTDAVDNAAGVDCSDHEVNIKILLDGVVADGDLTTKQRNVLLEEMTGDVARLVLADNYRQAVALTAARIDASSLIDVHARYLDDLEATGRIDRTLESLPDAENLAERRLAGTGLTTPELAVLTAYTKNLLHDELVASAVPDDEAMAALLRVYFPRAIQERFADRIPGHRLRREIVANQLANLVVDRAGETMLYRLTNESSAPAAEVAAAHHAAWTIFGLEDLVAEVARLDATMSVDRQVAVHLGCRQLAERATRLLIRNRPNPFATAKAIDDLADPVAATLSGLEGDLLGTDRAAFEAQFGELVGIGVADDLARRIALLPTAVSALDIVAVADASGRSIREVSAAYHAVADAFDLTWLRDRIAALPRDNQWSNLARLTLRSDLSADHRQLTSQIIGVAGRDDGTTAREQVDAWVQRHRAEVDRLRLTLVAIRTTTVDVTSLLVAAREVRNLIARTRSSGPVDPPA